MQDKIYLRVVTYKPVTLDDDEAVTMQKAAEISGYPLFDIQHKMDRGELPVLVRDTVAMKPRYTLRSAVKALPPYQPKRRLKEGEIALSKTSGAKREAIRSARMTEDS